MNRLLWTQLIFILFNTTAIAQFNTEVDTWINSINITQISDTVLVTDDTHSIEFIVEAYSKMSDTGNHERWIIDFIFVIYSNKEKGFIENFVNRGDKLKYHSVSDAFLKHNDYDPIRISLNRGTVYHNKSLETSYNYQIPYSADDPNHDDFSATDILKAYLNNDASFRFYLSYDNFIDFKLNKSVKALLRKFLNEIESIETNYKGEFFK